MGPCGRWKDGVVWIVGREAGAAAAAAQSAGEYVGGVWPLSPRAAPGPAGYQEPGIFFFFFGQACGREPTCMCCRIHLLTVPADPARGHSPGGFKMASAPPLCRGEEEKGREGAAAQPPGLLCVGRSPLPVSAAASAASSEWVSTRRPRRRNVRCCWAYGGHFRDR